MSNMKNSHKFVARGLARTVAALSRSTPIAGSLWLAGGGLSAAVMASSSRAAAPVADATSPMTTDLAQRLSQNVNRPVIVLMKNAFTGAKAARDQVPVMNELRQVKAQRIKHF
jgi:hypothetical protein